METRTIIPIARIHQPLKIEVDLEDDRIIDSRSSGTMFRGFELMLNGRDPRDAPYFTQRICGICSTAHGVAAALALEDACKVEITPAATIMRNLIFGADVLQNHLRHFYLLCMPDYIQGPNVPPFEPLSNFDKRLGKAENAKVLEHFWKAVDLSKNAHTMVAIFGGKAPHQHAIVPGGVSMMPDADNVARFIGLLGPILDFINGPMLEDLELISTRYDDYFHLGQGGGDFLSVGMFPKPGLTERYFPSGVYLDSRFSELNPDLITEDISNSWFKAANDIENPQDSLTTPYKNSSLGSTWLKAPRYGGKVVETGPLGRMWISGDYRQGTSTMDRITARVLETKKVGDWMTNWLTQLIPGQPTYTPFELIPNTRGIGLTEAMRGALGHWVTIEKHKIARYQIITPSAWLFSPKDSNGVRGTVDESLVGLKLHDLENYSDLGRIVRSYDPCFSCAGHVIRPGKDMGNFRIC